MTDLSRWLTNDADAPAGARELLSAAEPSASMPAEVHARLLAHAAEIAAAQPALGMGALLASKPASVGVAAVVAAAGALAAVHHRVAGEPDDHFTASRNAALVQKGLVARPDGARFVAYEASSSDCATCDIRTPVIAVDQLELEAAQPPSAAASAEPSALAWELELVDRARSALESDPEVSLRLAAEHARRFPAGQLAASREAIAIRALRALGRTEQARDRAQALVDTAPHSLHAAEARRIIEQGR